MKSKIYVGKTKEEAINNALIDLNAKEDEVVIIEKETKKRDDQLIYNIITSTSSVLIGKNGRTIEALQILALQMISTKYNTFYRFTVDVNDYKQKRKQRLEKLAKYTAKDVAKSKQAVSLEPMNSYERRIIHNALTNSTDVITISEGEEPNRYVIIKPKED